MNAAFRHFTLVTHRWLGVAAAAILAVTGASGALLAWPWPGDSETWRPIANRVHENLGLGLFGVAPVGYWMVTAASAVAVVLIAGGVVLWWRRRIVSVRLDRGLQVVACDTHHAMGVFGAAVMMLLTVSGVSIAFLRPEDGLLFEVMFTLHTTRGFPAPLKLVYMVGTIAFVIQVVSGVIMWWTPFVQRRTRSRAAALGRRAEAVDVSGAP